jgi:hypothetical protein
VPVTLHGHEPPLPVIHRNAALLAKVYWKSGCNAHILLQIFSRVRSFKVIQSWVICVFLLSSRKPI